MKNTLDQILNVTNSELDALNPSYILYHNFHHNTSYFGGQSGKEHYRLLMYISTLFEGVTLYDVGTNKCMSAAAMSYSKNNNIKSYDIIKLLPENPKLDNVEYILGDVREDKELINSPFIFFDVDHDGKFEKLFYEHLKEIKWNGLLMCDDIHLNEEMKSWWNNIPEDKYDLTDKGHWSGTGIVVLNKAE